MLVTLVREINERLHVHFIMHHLHPAELQIADDISKSKAKSIVRIEIANVITASCNKYNPAAPSLQKEGAAVYRIFINTLFCLAISITSWSRRLFR